MLLGKVDQEVQTWERHMSGRDEVMGESEILLEENMRRTKKAGV